MQQSTEYKITIEKIESGVPYKSKDWKIVSDTGEDDHRERKYDYVETTGTKTVETKVYEQVVENLDLGGLAVFVNTTQSKPPVAVTGNFGSPIKAKENLDGSQQASN